MNEAFGMMDEGYFKSRSDILKFVNDLLQVNVTKIESLGQGAVYCQILDAMFPGKVPLSKVNWKARLDWEFVNNLKVLQSAFTKIGIKKVLEVEKLSKCKYQDNLEMIQWLMRFYECNGNRPFADYDAVARRKGAEPDFSYADKIVVPKIFNLATPKQDNEKGGQAGTSNSGSKTKHEGVVSTENENIGNKQAGIKQTDKVKIVKEKNNILNKNDIVETKHTATQAGLKVTKPEIKAKVGVVSGKKEIKSSHLTAKKPSSQADSLKLQQIKDVMSTHSLSNTGKLSQIAGILGVILSSNQGQQHQNLPDSQLTHNNMIVKVTNNQQNESDQENVNAQEEHNDPESNLDEHVQEATQEIEDHNLEEINNSGHDQQDQEEAEEEQEQEDIEGEEEEKQAGEQEIYEENQHDQEEEQQQVEEQDEDGKPDEGTTQEQLQHNNLKISPEEEKIKGKLSAEIQDIDGLLDNLIDSNDHDLLHSGHDQEEGDEVI